MPYADPIKRREYAKIHNKAWYLKAKFRYSGVCCYCGKQFNSRYKEQTTCSLACAGHNVRHSKQCEYCGKEFFCPPTQFSRKKYCSAECRNKRKIENYIKSNCKQCGVVMLSPPSRVRKYCSVTCMNKDPDVQKRLRGVGKRVDTPEHRKISAELCRQKVGSKNPAWKGGITPLHRAVRADSRYLNWRKSVFERDNYICCDCGAKGVYLQAHHLFPFAVLLKEKNWTVMWDISNGRTLCLSCHKKTDNYGKNPKLNYL